MQHNTRSKILLTFITALTFVGAVCLCLGLILIFKFYNPLKTTKSLEFIQTLGSGGFVITSPTQNSFISDEPIVTFTGVCNPKYPLDLNGKEIAVDSSGNFSATVNLNHGENTLVFSHNEVSYTYKIAYNFTLIKSITPTEPLYAESGSMLIISAYARSGSNVTAEFNGKKTTLTSTPANNTDKTNSDYNFTEYQGTINLQNVLNEDLNLGAIKFTATYNSKSQSMSSADITVKKPPAGSFIAEVISANAETFDAGTVDDYSRPTNNYLPKGTVDYCSPGTVINLSTNCNYKTLRCGKRVYSDNTVKTYEGTLPDVNNISISELTETDRYTTLILKTDWKAPFKFEINNQDYTDISKRDYTFNTPTYSYIDITFYYADSLTGSIKFSKNPIFKGYTIIENEYNCTLRLYLSNTGCFYGWSAEYDSKGNLCFKFLKPAKITNADNSYGVSLNGVTVFVDAGHGGSDVGAVGKNKRYTEADLNLKLALAIKEELESIGAAVKMSRTTNESIEPSDRIARLKNAEANLSVSVHRNYSSDSSVSAFNTYHFNPFTKTAADLIYNSTSHLYKTTEHSGVKWHYFYMSRITDCPVVLTENGYITNAEEFTKLIDDDFNKECAKAITKGIVDYFISIQ